MDCWIDSASLSFDNSFQDVCSRGFKIPTKGLRVSLGNLGIPGISPSDETRESATISNARVAAGRRLFEFILCKSGVGRSVVLNNEEELLSERFELPVGYDSVFLKSTSDRNEISHSTAPPSGTLLNKNAPPGLAASLAIAHDDSHGDASLIPARSFRHDYVIFDTSQVLPMFSVQFIFDPTLPEHLLAHLCDSCNKEAATLWCAADSAALCPDCDEYLHSRNKLTRRHVRVSINEREAPPPPCKEHIGEKMTLYCPSCRIPLCRVCRSHGSHSSGPSALHRIVLLKDAYAAALADTADMPTPADFLLAPGGGGSVDEATAKIDRSLTAVNSLLEAPSSSGGGGPQKGSQTAINLAKRRQWIEEQLQVLDDVLRTVRANTLEAEERTIVILEDALKELQEETEHDMSRLLGDQIEIRRQLDQLGWANSFLNDLRNVLPAADFLYSWLRHCRLTEELSTLGVSTFPEVQLYDLRIEGGVHLLSEAALRQQTALQRQRALEVSHQTASNWANQEREMRNTISSQHRRGASTSMNNSKGDANLGEFNATDKTRHVGSSMNVRPIGGEGQPDNQNPQNLNNSGNFLGNTGASSRRDPSNLRGGLGSGTQRNGALASTEGVLNNALL